MNFPCLVYDMSDGSVIVAEGYIGICRIQVSGLHLNFIRFQQLSEHQWRYCMKLSKMMCIINWLCDHLVNIYYYSSIVGCKSWSQSSHYSSTDTVIPIPVQVQHSYQTDTDTDIGFNIYIKSIPIKVSTFISNQQRCSLEPFQQSQRGS